MEKDISGLDNVENDSGNHQNDTEQEDISENRFNRISIENQIWKSLNRRLNKIPDDPLVTLSEVIEAHEELEAEAEALLGGANANVCTYPEVIF
ncbi:unnamed protein product [Brugia timori]|uniref:Uncharacterized protein n=1 Tax=Brugia timori TaxID=42155 RepID=A0A0R3QVK9_9BILA|nr:unnamed protein product [Brugia timori]